MNKSAIQKFAIWARTTLMEQVAQRAYQYGITKDGYGEENAVTVNGMALSPRSRASAGSWCGRSKPRAMTR